MFYNNNSFSWLTQIDICYRQFSMSEVYILYSFFLIAAGTYTYDFQSDGRTTTLSDCLIDSNELNRIRNVMQKNFREQDEVEGKFCIY